MASRNGSEQGILIEQLVHQGGSCSGRALSGVGGGEGEDGGFHGSRDLRVRRQGQDHANLGTGGRHIREGGHDGGLVDGREPPDLALGLVVVGGLMVVLVVVVVVLVLVQVRVLVVVVQGQLVVVGMGVHPVSVLVVVVMVGRVAGVVVRACVVGVHMVVVVAVVVGVSVMVAVAAACRVVVCVVV